MLKGASWGAIWLGWRLPLSVFCSCSPGRRPQGRPRIHWKDVTLIWPGNVLGFSRRIWEGHLEYLAQHASTATCPGCPTSLTPTSDRTTTLAIKGNEASVHSCWISPGPIITVARTDYGFSRRCSGFHRLHHDATFQQQQPRRSSQSLLCWVAIDCTGVQALWL